MQLTKNLIFQSIFFIILFVGSILNGSNSNIFIQLNFIFFAIFFLSCLRHQNYKSHLIKFINDNKFILFLSLLFATYIIFQIIPLPIEVLKRISPNTYVLLNSLDYDTKYFPISLSPSNTFFQLLNFTVIILIIFLIKMIFYKKRHLFRFFYFIILIGAFHSFVAVSLWLTGNQNFIFEKIAYLNSSTGFFVNRTVFSVFLNLCLIAGLQYLFLVNHNPTKNNNSLFWDVVYVRLLLVFIVIAIITTFSRLGNFIFAATVLFYLLFSMINSKKILNNFSIVLIFLIIFDIAILGYFFGAEKLLNRFLFISDSFQIKEQSLVNYNRISIIIFGIEQIKQNLFFGYGLGGFESVFKIYFPTENSFYANHAHSDFIELVGELGFLGSLIFFTIIFSVFYKIIFLNKFGENKKIFFTFLLCLIFLIIIVLSFDFSLHIPSVQYLCIGLISLLNNLMFFEKKLSHKN